MAARKKTQPPISIVTRVPDLQMTHLAPAEKASQSATETPAPAVPATTEPTAANVTPPAVEVSPAVKTPPAANSNWKIPEFAQLAAAVAAAVVAGAVLGAATTAGMMHLASLTSLSAQQTASAKLSDDIAGLKTDLGSAQRSLSMQLDVLRERVQYAEAAQAEPATKLARLAEGLERLERRLQSTMALNAQAAADVTGSLPAPKDASKPQAAEGWRVRDYRSGVVVVQNNAGTSFEVTLGSNLPGLGRVEAIKRDDSRIAVITKNGIITGPSDRKPRPGSDSNR